MIVRATQTGEYGSVRRFPAQYDDDGNLTRKADIFMLRTRKGFDAKNKPVVLSPEDQFDASWMEKVDVNSANRHDVNCAKIEHDQVVSFEKQQEMLDEESKAIKAIEQNESRPTQVRPEDDPNLQNDLKQFTEMKSSEELAAEVGSGDSDVLS